MIVDRFIEPVLALPRVIKRLIAVAVDAGLCALTVWFAFYLRLGEWVPLSGEASPSIVVAIAVAIPVFTVSGLYRAVFRYVNLSALVAIARAVAAYGVIYAAIFTAYAVEDVPRTIGIIQPILLFIAVASSRAAARYILGGAYREHLRRDLKRNVLIYGAGVAGRQLASALRGSSELRVVGFLDDASDLQGNVVAGQRVWAPERLEQLVGRFEVSEVILAVASAERTRRNEILDRLRPLNVSVRTLPGILDLAHGKITARDLRPLEVDDLLGRDAVDPDRSLLERTIRGKVVMVTGAGGSIGSELCRQIVTMDPAKLLLIDANEFALYSIHGELERAADEGETALVPLLGSVCDQVRMARIMETYRPDTVYHAAAYKHVPLVEHNVVEGVRNNVLGTHVCATLARRFGVADFVLISTDKAVRPTNVMGATKRAAEMILQANASENPQTRFSMVRFGNVLGSSGSVVPLFRSQIANGGPVTVTHPEVIRYFMTIPEAAQLVLQAGALSKGGEVFVLDMGEPVRIVDLARRMIELSGLRVRQPDQDEGDIEIVFSGLRPGEKLYEELLIGEDPSATSHPRIMMARESFIPAAELSSRLAALRELLAEQDPERVRGWLIDLVREYTPSDENVDFLLRKTLTEAAE